MSKFIFNYGVVNSRKSAELLLTIHRNCEIAGKSALILQSDINSRDGGFIKSRALKYEVEAILVGKDTSIKSLYNGEELIFVDEIQFFTKQQIDELIELMLENKVLIFAYGLMSNFKGELFETISYMLPFVTKIVEIPTVCEMCGDAKATMNLLIDNGKNQGSEIIVGNHFKGVCLKCWNKIQKLEYLPKLKKNTDIKALNKNRSVLEQLEEYYDLSVSKEAMEKNIKASQLVEKLRS